MFKMVLSGIKKLLLTAAVVFGLCMAVSAATTGPPASGAVLQGSGITGQPATVVPPGSAMTAQPASAGATDIHDIRDPVQVGVNPAIYYWIAGGVALLIAASGLWWLIRRRKKMRDKDMPHVSATVFKTPEAEALDDLALLETTPPDQPAVFYFRLSAIFRRYLERRFDIDAMEMTTEELLPCLGRLEFDRENRAGIKKFLTFGDRVKFARVLPDTADMMGHLGLVKNIVNHYKAVDATAETGGEH